MSDPVLSVLGSLTDVGVSLRRLTLFQVSLPHRELFRSAIGERRHRRALLVRWEDRSGGWGVGECSCRPDPYFNAEFADGAVEVLRRFVLPGLSRRRTVGEVIASTSRVRGWSFTVSALLDALLDLLRRRGVADAIERWRATPARAVPVGISLGLFESAAQATRAVGAAVADGYRRVKMKISPRMDRDIPVAVRESFPELALGFDANGSCREDDLAFLEGLAELRPALLEQPCPPRRIDLVAAVRARLPGVAVCLDESIEGLGDLVSAHRLGAVDQLNLKPGRVGGQIETLRQLAYCERHRIPVWIGGMFETGIGRAALLRIAARLPGSPPHDLRPPSGYLGTDLVASPLEMDDKGSVLLPHDRPVEVDWPAVERCCDRRIELE